MSRKKVFMWAKPQRGCFPSTLIGQQAAVVRIDISCHRRAVPGALFSNNRSRSQSPYVHDFGIKWGRI